METRTSTSLRILVGCAVGSLAGMLFVPRFGQDQAYHDFADQGTLWGVPHFWNVLSNVPFVVTGVAGLLLAQSRPNRPEGPISDDRERAALVATFLAFLLTGLGSAWYHLDPNDDTLLWDRLPISMLSVGTLCIVFQERVSVAAGKHLLLPGVFVGAASTVWWWWTESQGSGDLRLYVWVLSISSLLVLMLLVLFPPRYTRGADWVTALVLYGMSRVTEILDRVVMELPLLFSGHTWKHLFAAMATVWVVVHVALRRRI